MDFIQTKDILAKAAEFHRRLGSYYEAEKDNLEEEKMKLLLYYLSRHEKRLAELIERFTKDSEPAIINTWFKYMPPSLKALLSVELQIPEGSTTDDLVQIALGMDKLLIQFYEDAADRALSSDVREMFENLIKQEEQEEYRLAKATFGEL